MEVFGGMRFFLVKFCVDIDVEFLELVLIYCFYVYEYGGILYNECLEFFGDLVFG